MKIASSANFGVSKTGLSTVGYELVDIFGNIKTARTTTGVSEVGSSGMYKAIIDIEDGWVGHIFWDTGDASPEYVNNDVNFQRDGEIFDRTIYILEALATHRKSVEPLIYKLGTKKADTNIEKTLEQIKKLVKGIDKPDFKPIENHLKELKRQVEDIHIPEMPKIEFPEIKLQNVKEIKRIIDMVQHIVHGYNDIRKKLSEIKKDNDLMPVINEIKSTEAVIVNKISKESKVVQDKTAMVESTIYGGIDKAVKDMNLQKIQADKLKQFKMIKGIR